VHFAGRIDLGRHVAQRLWRHPAAVRILHCGRRLRSGEELVDPTAPAQQISDRRTVVLRRSLPAAPVQPPVSVRTAAVTPSIALVASVLASVRSSRLRTAAGSGTPAGDGKRTTVGTLAVADGSDAPLAVGSLFDAPPEHAATATSNAAKRTDQGGTALWGADVVLGRRRQLGAIWARQVPGRPAPHDRRLRMHILLLDRPAASNLTATASARWDLPHQVPSLPRLRTRKESPYLQGTSGRFHGLIGGQTHRAAAPVGLRRGCP
jgi:hypothetical protein